MYISLLIFMTVMINLYNGINVFLVNRSSVVHKVFLLLCLDVCLWGIGYIFMLNSDNAAGALMWHDFAIMGQCLLFSSFLLFSIVFTNQRGLLGRLPIKVLMFLPSVLLFFEGAPKTAADFSFTDWGWMYANDFTGVWKEIYISYYLLYTVTAVWLLYSWGKRARTTREKKQAWLIIRIALGVLISGIFFDLGAPFWDIKAMPTDVIVMTMLTGGIWYAIVKYKLMLLDFQFAADYILQDMVDPLILTDRNLVITEINKAAEHLTGYVKADLTGQALHDVLGWQFEVAAAQSNILHDQNFTNMEVDIFNHQTGKIPCLLSVKTLYDEFHEVLGKILLLHDITKRKDYEQLLRKNNEELERKVRERTTELQTSNFSLKREVLERKNIEAELRYMATHDSLTSLPNRRLYNERLTAAIQKAQQSKESLAVAFLDMDNFKFLNDTFGHRYGDSVLKEVALYLEKVIKPEDVLARVGGDEFLVLVEHLDKEQAENTMKLMLANLLDLFKQPYVINGRECFLSVSVGVALYPEDGEDAETLIRNADIAMYDAKYTSKGTYKICSVQMKKKAAKKSEIRRFLFHALEREELMLYYQPQVDIASKRIKGFEALLRWKVQGNFVSPSDFIPIAEETGMIVPIGRWVISTAFRQLKEWHNMGYQHLKMAVNVSVRQLVEKSFVKELIDCLDNLELAHRFVELEITESIAFNQDTAILDMLHEIKKEDINLSIDDFGTEYSSFMNIKDVPVNRLKIAMPFVSGILKNRKDAAIVSSIIALSHNLGLHVIAEGVENQAEAEYLGMEKCDEIQGYYYYRPMPPEHIMEILDSADDALIM